MPRIRTDRHALFLALAMASAFFFFCTRNYVLELPEAMRTWDRLLLWCLGGGLVYFALFVAGHLALRRAAVGNRAAYAGVGAAACVVAFCVLGAFGELIDAFRRGAGIGYLIAPAALGAVFGFLYAWRASWESEADEPAALADALASRSAEERDPVHVRTGDADYYAGPMQVRTSIPLMLLAALFASMLTGLARGVMLVGHEVSLLGDAGMSRMVEHALQSTGAAGFELFGLMLISVLPMTVMILAGHYVARAFRWESPAAYFGVGLVMPPILAAVTMLLFLVIALMIILPTAVAMVIYRQMAGLEPVPVKDDVIVRDPRDLVGADHPRRQFGRVIRSR